jgi:hypothetical protein
VILRNYFDPRLGFKRNVYHHPLGWTSTFNNQIFLEESPSYHWSFCGTAKADRKEMFNQLHDVGESFIHFSSGWGSDDQLRPEEVRQVCASSNFFLCHQGKAHVDSFRVMEALQAGPVPVAVKFFRIGFSATPLAFTPLELLLLATGNMRRNL